MKEKMRTIGYLCPRCRKPVMQQRSRFALAASGAIVQCECGKSELQIDFDGEKFRISVPCGVCGGEHLAECGADRLLDGEGIGLACPETSELCCFIGEEYAVERALEQLQITAEKQSAQGDAPEAFTDTVIMYEVLSELKEIAARPRGITCACGSERYRMQVRPAAVDLICEDCGAKLLAITFDDGPGKYTGALLDGLAERGVHATFFVNGVNASGWPETLKRIVAATDEDLDRLCCRMTLQIPGKKG